MRFNFTFIVCDHGAMQQVPVENSTHTLAESLRAWGTPGFSTVMKQALERLQPGQLPLENTLQYGSYVNHDSISVMIIRAGEKDGVVDVLAGLFFTSMLTGCSCADDPSSDVEYSEYSELQISFNLASNDVTISFV